MLQGCTGVQSVSNTQVLQLKAVQIGPSTSLRRVLVREIGTGFK